MDVWYILGGLASIGLGGYITFIQIRKFTTGQNDKLGFSIQVLASGAFFIMIGIAVAAKYI